MKRLACVLWLSLVVVATGTDVLAQQRETPPVRFEPITNTIYQVLGGRGANGGAFIGETAVVLIDSKMD